MNSTESVESMQVHATTDPYSGNVIVIAKRRELPRGPAAGQPARKYGTGVILAEEYLDDLHRWGGKELVSHYVTAVASLLCEAVRSGNDPLHEFEAVPLRTVDSFFTADAIEAAAHVSRLRSTPRTFSMHSHDYTVGIDETGVVNCVVVRHKP